MIDLVDYFVFCLHSLAELWCYLCFIRGLSFFSPFSVILILAIQPALTCVDNKKKIILKRFWWNQDNSSFIYCIVKWNEKHGIFYKIARWTKYNLALISIELRNSINLCNSAMLSNLSLELVKENSSLH